jgi:hypothetical protein
MSMRRLGCLLLAFALSGLALADAPFPDTPKNHWVYTTMKQIRREKLWYRVNDNVPRRAVATRMDVATKALYLALDTQTLVDSLQRTVNVISVPAADSQSKKWAQDFAASFPKKKLLYQTHMKRVIKLWHYFKPEIMVLTTRLKVDPKVIGNRLVRDQKQLDKVHLSGAVALYEGFSDVPEGHWAAAAVNDLKKAGILAGYPAS